MIHTKPIAEITYQDVLDFCAEGLRESIYLEYKADLDGGFARTAAAMANTWGGVIVIGVAKEDGRPALPVPGAPYDAHLRERINNLILAEVTPPVFPDVQVCAAPDGARALIVVRVAQSSLTPHAIRGNTQVYLRTDRDDEREDLARIERVQWLIDKRKRSEDLKSSFFAVAENRFDTLCRRNNVSIYHSDGTLAASPTFPLEILRKPKDLRESVLQEIRVRGLDHEPFPTLGEGVRFEAVQNGTYGFKHSDVTGFACYEELNQYGFFYHREDFGHSGTLESGKEVHFANLHSFLARIDGFLESAVKLYKCLGYWGSVDLKITLRKLAVASIRDLPPSKGKFRSEHVVSRPIDAGLGWSESVPYGELAERRVDWVVKMFLDVAWGLGFSNVTEATVRKLLEEGGRG